jgi:protein MpaA
VDESGGSLTVERRFATVLQEPLRRMLRYPGSAVSWENQLLPGSTAFVVELPRSVSQLLDARAVAAVSELMSTHNGAG